MPHPFRLRKHLIFPADKTDFYPIETALTQQPPKSAASFPIPLRLSFLYTKNIASIVGVSVQSVSRWLHSVYNNKNIDLPNVSPFKQIRYADILSYLAGLNEKELKRECIVLFSSLDSGCEISLLISKQKTEQQKGRP